MKQSSYIVSINCIDSFKTTGTISFFIVDDTYSDANGFLLSYSVSSLDCHWRMKGQSLSFTLDRLSAAVVAVSQEIWFVFDWRSFKIDRPRITLWRHFVTFWTDTAVTMAIPTPIGTSNIYNCIFTFTFVYFYDSSLHNFICVNLLIC